MKRESRMGLKTRVMRYVALFLVILFVLVQIQTFAVNLWWSSYHPPTSDIIVHVRFPQEVALLYLLGIFVIAPFLSACIVYIIHKSNQSPT